MMLRSRPVFLLAMADILIVLMVLLFGYSAWKLINKYGYPEIEKVNIHGLSPVMESLKLKGILNRELKTGYFALNETKLADDIATVSFVRRARIVRNLPLSLDIYLESHVPVAYWQKNRNAEVSHRILVNDQADVFYVEPAYDTDLPVLSSIYLGDQLQDRLFREALVQRLQVWQDWGEKQGLGKKITRLDIVHGLMWELEWDHQVQVKLGSWKARSSQNTTNQGSSGNAEKQFLAYWSVEDLAVLDKSMHRFYTALPILYERYGKVPLVVDMRYPTAMAVRKKKQS